MAKRQKKSARKATADADKPPSPPVAPSGSRSRLAEALGGQASVPGVSALLDEAKHPLDTIEGCRRVVQDLHHEISMRHDWETAERIFKSLPTAASFRKRFREVQLRTACELLRSSDSGWRSTKIAKHLHKVFPGEYGNSWQAIERHILRLERPQS
jgi:hypothetical protein